MSRTALLLLETDLSEPTRYVMSELNNVAVATTADMEVDGEGATSADGAQVLSEVVGQTDQTTQGDNGIRPGEPRRWPSSNPRRPGLCA